MSEQKRRTKRRYAHELYPHPDDEFEVRPLAVEVPYRYARAIGMQVWGTGWFDAHRHGDQWAREAADSRTLLLIAARESALLADALLQGLSGQEAWEWAQSRVDESGEWTWERAAHYGVPINQIKPYPCGPEPENHSHRVQMIGFSYMHRVDGRESECDDCTEAVSTDE